MDLPATTDIVIIGAGVIGLGIAYHLAEMGQRRVIVVDKFNFLGGGSSGRSAGGFRQQFPLEEKIRLAKLSKQFFDAFPERFEFPLNFKKKGYLLLAQTEEEEKNLVRDRVVQLKCQVPVEHLDQADIGQRFPYLMTADIKGANFCREDGYLDPHSLLQAYLQGAIRAGHTIFFGCEVTNITWDSLRKSFQIVTSSGTITCGTLINAAGAWANTIASFLGEQLPLRVRKRQIFVSGPFPEIKETPLIIQSHDPFYFRKEGDCFILSVAEEDIIAEELFDSPPLDWSHSALLAERASTRVPQFEELRLSKGWAGLRTLTPDTKPVVCRSQVCDSFYHACGLSGHGITFSPAIGSLMARLVTGDQSVHELLKPFALDRFGASLRKN